MVHHDLLHKVVVEEILVPCKEGDAVADGTVVVKADSVALRRPKLAHSVTTVASMDIMHPNVHGQQVHPGAAVLRNLSISAVMWPKLMGIELEEEETGEVAATEGPGFLV